MSSASVSVHEAKESNVSRLAYEVTLIGPNGAPVVGEDLAVTVDGDGSISPNFSAKDTRIVTNDAGTARFTWFRRSIYGRDVKATLSVTSARTDATVSMQSVAPEASSLSYDISGKHHAKFMP